MFDIAPSELLLVGLVALLVVGPKELPRLMRGVAQWVRKARGMAMQFRAGFEQMMHEADLADERARVKAMQEAHAAQPDQPAAPQDAASHDAAVQAYAEAAQARVMGMAAEEASSDPSSVREQPVYSVQQPDFTDVDEPAATVHADAAAGVHADAAAGAAKADTAVAPDMKADETVAFPAPAEEPAVERKQ